MNTLAFFEGMFSGSHLLIILVVALLIFGHRLPEVARNMGKSVVEFKKGLKGVEDDARTAGEVAPRRELPPREAAYHDDRRGAPRDEHVEVSQHPPTSQTN